MTINVVRHRLIEPRASGDVRPPQGACANGRKLVLTVETVRSLRVRTHVRAGIDSSGAPCGTGDRQLQPALPAPLQMTIDAP